MYRPEEFAGPSACESPDELAAIGWLPGIDRTGPPAYLDPIEEERTRPAGESPWGVEVRRHPEAMLRDDPALHQVVDMWRTGATRKLTHAGYNRLSNFEIEARAVLRAATQRERMRRISEREESGEP